MANIFFKKKTLMPTLISSRPHILTPLLLFDPNPKQEETQ